MTNTERELQNEAPAPYFLYSAVVKPPVELVVFRFVRVVCAVTPAVSAGEKTSDEPEGKSDYSPNTFKTEISKYD